MWNNENAIEQSVGQRALNLRQLNALRVRKSSGVNESSAEFASDAAREHEVER